MENFTIFGEQKTLTQWDVGRKITVTIPCEYVHFANAAMTEAMVCQVRESEGQRIADIPDEVLQVAGVLRVYAFSVTAGENYTKWTENLFIRARPKPDNYLYTPTTGVSWMELVGRVEGLEEKTAEKPTYTAEEVGARPDTWMPTAAEVGAAPAGFGLGEAPRTSADVNAELSTGYFRTTSATDNSPFNHGAAHVRKYSDSEVVQNLFRVTAGVEMVRYTTDGGATWIEEYVNPTMNAGTEYRTTERYNGKAVYKQVINIGSIPNGESAISHNITGIATALSVELTDGASAITQYRCIDKVWFDTASVKIIASAATFASATIYATLTYTKK